MCLKEDKGGRKERKAGEEEGERGRRTISSKLGLEHFRNSVAELLRELHKQNRTLEIQKKMKNRWKH